MGHLGESKGEKMNNYIKIAGTVTNIKERYTIKQTGQDFQVIELSVKRKSGIVDKLNVHIPTNIECVNDLEVTHKVCVAGEIRSRNVKDINGKSHLQIYVFVREALNYEEDCNEVSLIGFVCKAPVYRETPLKKRICDFLIAVNRGMKMKSDYLPIIAWNKVAKYCKDFRVSNAINLTGKLQSRIYVKDGIEHTAYEISVENIILHFTDDADFTDFTDLEVIDL